MTDPAFSGFDGDPHVLVRAAGEKLTDVVAETSCPGLHEWLQGDEFWHLVVQQANAEYVAAAVAFETEPSDETLERRACVRLRVTWYNVRNAYDHELGGAS